MHATKRGKKQHQNMWIIKMYFYAEFYSLVSLQLLYVFTKTSMKYEQRELGKKLLETDESNSGCDFRSFLFTSQMTTMKLPSFGPLSTF